MKQAIVSQYHYRLGVQISLSLRPASCVLQFKSSPAGVINRLNQKLPINNNRNTETGGKLTIPEFMAPKLRMVISHRKLSEKDTKKG